MFHFKGKILFWILFSFKNGVNRFIFISMRNALNDIVSWFNIEFHLLNLNIGSQNSFRISRFIHKIRIAIEWNFSLATDIKSVKIYKYTHATKISSFLVTLMRFKVMKSEPWNTSWKVNVGNILPDFSISLTG